MEKDNHATCSCKVSLKSVQLLQIISQKCVGQPESTARQCSFVWQISHKNINFVLTLSKAMLKYAAIAYIESRKCFRSRANRYMYILHKDRPEKANVARNYEYSLHVKFHRNPERRGCLVPILPTPGPARGMIFPK